MTYNVFGGTLDLTQLRLVMWSVYGIFIPVQVKPLVCPGYNDDLLPSLTDHSQCNLTF